MAAFRRNMLREADAIRRQVGLSPATVRLQFNAGGALREARSVSTQIASVFARPLTQVVRVVQQGGARVGSAVRGAGALAAGAAGMAAGPLVAGGVAALGAVAGGVAGAFSGVRMASDLEQTTVAFETMLGSAERAGGFIRELQAFAAQTPFELPGLLDSTKQMLAMGFASQDVLPSLRVLGDVASGLGIGTEGIQQMTRALGQMAMRGTLAAEEMNQLAEAGVPAWEALRVGLAKSGREYANVAQLQEAVTKRQIDGVTAQKALIAGMGDAQFGFAGMMQRQSQTMSGLLSTIRDTFNQSLLLPFGQGIANVILPRVRELATWLSENGTQVSALGAALGKFGGSMTELVLRPLEGVVRAMGSFVSSGGAERFTTAANAIVGALGMRIEQVGAAFATIGRNVWDVAKRFSPLVGDLFARSVQFGANLRDLVGAFSPIAQAALNAFSGVGELLGRVRDALAPIAGAAAAGLGGLANWMLGIDPKPVSDLSGHFGWLRDTLDKLKVFTETWSIRDFLRMFSPLPDNQFNARFDALANALGWLGTQWNNLGGVIDRVWLRVGDLGVWDDLGAIMSSVGGIVQGLWGLMNSLENLALRPLTWAVEKLTGETDVLSGAFGNVTGITFSVDRAVEMFALRVKDTTAGVREFVSFVERLVNTFRDLIDAIKNLDLTKIKDLWTTAKQLFSGGLSGTPGASTTGGSSFTGPGPVPGAVTQEYGFTEFARQNPQIYRQTGGMHTGLDYEAPMNTPVAAMYGGKVAAVGEDGGYGLRVLIQHNNGLSTLYGHLNEVMVEAAQMVEAGQQIGLSGNSGASTGPHLHYEERLHGTPISPGSTKGFAWGGLITEPISGIGMSGRQYTFGEYGRHERVTPLGASHAGGKSGNTINVSLDGAIFQANGINDPERLSREMADHMAAAIADKLSETLENLS